jgi:hypothetical protein
MHVWKSQGKKLPGRPRHNIVMIYVWLQMGCGLVNGFIDHLYTHDLDLQALNNAVADF